MQSICWLLHVARLCNSAFKPGHNCCCLQVNDGEPLEVLTDEVKDAIMKNIRRRMTPQPVKIRADVELTCFSYDGILHIQVGRRWHGLTIDSESSARWGCWGNTWQQQM